MAADLSSERLRALLARIDAAGDGWLGVLYAEPETPGWDDLAREVLSLRSPWRSVATDPPPYQTEVLTIARHNPMILVRVIDKIDGADAWICPRTNHYYGGDATPLHWMPIPPLPSEVTDAPEALARLLAEKAGVEVIRG